jgi:HAD superfamily hydrolase (TIGR01509 family)
MSAIKAIFWDSDNTLIDTFALHWAKHKVVLKSLNIDLNDRYQTRIHHNNGIQNWEWMKAELGLKLPQNDYISLIDSYFKDHSSDLKLRSGVTETLDYFTKKKLPQIVVSNGRKDSVETSQRATNIYDRFNFILCKEDYEGRKPEPTPFMTALARLQKETGKIIRPQDCLAIDDDPLGVESAHRAGMITIYRPTNLVPQSCVHADYTALTTDDFVGLCKSLVK